MPEDNNISQGPVASSAMSPVSATSEAGFLLTKKGRWFFRILDICSLLFWLYVVVKIFFFDFDVLLVQQAFPTHAWLLNLRFICLLAALAVALLVFDKKNV